MEQLKPEPKPLQIKPSQLTANWLKKITKQDYQKDIILIISIATAAFVYLSIFSYQPYDPSLYSIVQPSTSPENMGGILGSYLTGFLVYHLGLLSVFAPIPIIWWGIRQFRLRSLDRLTSPLFFGWGLMFIGSGSLLQKYFSQIPFHGILFPIAGQLGIYTNFSTEKIFGSVGHDLIFIAVILIGFIRLTEKPIIKRCLESRLFTFPEKLSFWLKRKKSITPSRKDAKYLDTKQDANDIIEIQPIAEMPVTLNHPENFTESSTLSNDEPVISPQMTISNNDQKELKKLHIQPQYQPPPTGIFQSNANKSRFKKQQMHELEETASQLISTLADFNIEGTIVAIQPGPVVAVYEFQPKAGIKLSKVTSLIDDIALALKVDSIFILPVSGKRALGIQVPNQKREMVYMGDILSDEIFSGASSPLTFAMGKSLSGKPVCEDLAAMPHLLMAGQTGSGKSVAINTLLCSILMKSRPDQVRFIMVDPKILELKVYEGIPHLLMPVITEASKASLALKWACFEMDRRYKLMESAKVRNLEGFNKFWHSATAEQREFICQQAEVQELEPLPLIVVIIDELADLMLTAPKDVEGSIQRLAQKARASGIHLVLATQRPSVDVITGVIKANLPCRCSFKVFSRGDSRTILDSMGAERLLGKGDMLFLKPGVSRLERIQGAFLDDQEVVTLVSEIKKVHGENYDENAISWIEEAYENNELSKKDGTIDDGSDVTEDPKWDEALAIAQTQGHISASFLQRSLKIGYNRAARLVDAMFAQGLISAANGAKTRKWIGAPSHLND